jgi:hypothetical protein
MMWKWSVVFVQTKTQGTGNSKRNNLICFSGPSGLRCQRGHMHACVVVLMMVEGENMRHKSTMPVRYHSTSWAATRCA